MTMKRWSWMIVVLIVISNLIIFSQKANDMSQEGISKAAQIFEQRSQDWRNRQIVYQIFVDRFARSLSLENKKKNGLYDKPRKLMEWEEKPNVGKELKEFGCWSHELEFWGGDLQGVTQHIHYLNELGINTIYLNPIFHAFTNHKYDALDYFSIDPQFGNWDDLKNLTDRAHRSQMKVILDGVFNHVGKKSPWFIFAQDPSSPYRNFFYFSDCYPLGYRAWANVGNLPELNLENREVQKLIFDDKDSVVQHYLTLVDGWRLDVAFDLGPEILKKITDNSHQMKQDSLVTGEIWNYPDGWLKVLDGLMNYPLRHVLLEMVNGRMSPSLARRFMDKMIQDSGIEKILQCWTILSSHDTPRMKELIPDPDLRKIAIILQFTLPGAPVIYYGEELGMTGKDDPCNRGAMEWNKYSPKNPDFQFFQSMIQLRNRFPSLQYGDFFSLESDDIFAFYRCTDRIKDMVIVAVNTKDIEVSTTILVPEYRLMNWAKLQDALSTTQIPVFCGMLQFKMPPKSSLVLYPITEVNDQYNPYKRVK